MTKSHHPIARPPVSRRTVLKGASALGAASLILPASALRAKAQPKRGGTLRVGIAAGNTSDSLDPGSWSHVYTQVLATAMHGFLVEVAADGSLIGEVAESWEASPDARVWTFKIRSGVEYHSGRTVTPEDVVASIEYHRKEGSTSAALPIVEPIETIAAEGDTVIFTLQNGNADFPFLMSDYHLAIVPANDGAIDPLGSDGCGPYRLDAFDPGVRADMTKHANYWKEGRGHFDGVQLLVILDAAARQAALMTDSVDVIDQVDLKTVALLERAPNVSVLATTGTQHYTFAMDTRLAPFDDNNVRQALKYGVNREELVEKILFGYGEIGNDHPIGRSNRYYAADLEQTPYDPDRAKFHLREAGLDSVDVALSAADAAFGGAVDAALLYSESARPAGINVEVVREPNDGYWSDVWMQKPFVSVYWGGRPTEDWMFSLTYATGAAWNDTFWSNERFDTLLLEARSELDEVKRADMYREMQNIVRTEGGAVVPLFASFVMAHSNKVAHPEEVASNWTLDGFRAIERWWFA